MSLAEAGFDIVEREVAHLVFEAGEIHGRQPNVESWGAGDRGRECVEVAVGRAARLEVRESAFR